MHGRQEGPRVVLTASAFAASRERRAEMNTRQGQTQRTTRYRPTGRPGEATALCTPAAVNMGLTSPAMLADVSPRPRRGSPTGGLRRIALLGRFGDHVLLTHRLSGGASRNQQEQERCDQYAEGYPASRASRSWHSLSR
jgi:hypothetical protein